MNATSFSPDNPQPAIDASKRKHRSRTHQMIAQLTDGQEMLMADILNPETTASHRAQCMRAYTLATDQIRILRMQPKPRDLDTTELAKNRAKRRSKTPIILEPE